MFPEEEESQVGRQIQVKLPGYLLLAKGNVELQGRNFIAASTMAPISEEGITLSDFIPYREKVYNWSSAPTREGRTMLVQVFSNLQKVMVVYHGKNYGSCCEDVLTLLEENADILRKFNDAYIQIKFEMTLSQFFQDIYKEKESLTYPSMKMDSPINCAALLKM
jgi:hypothetical protein